MNKSDNSSIYKLSTEDGKRIKLNSEKSFFPNVLDDWIYYKKIDTASNNEVNIEKLYRGDMLPPPIEVGASWDIPATAGIITRLSPFAQWF